MLRIFCEYIIAENIKVYVGQQKKALQAAPLRAHKSCRPESGKHSEVPAFGLWQETEKFYLQIHLHILFLIAYLSN